MLGQSDGVGSGFVVYLSRLLVYHDGRISSRVVGLSLVVSCFVVNRRFSWPSWCMIASERTRFGRSYFLKHRFMIFGSGRYFYIFYNRIWLFPVKFGSLTHARSGQVLLDGRVSVVCDRTWSSMVVFSSCMVVVGFVGGMWSWSVASDRSVLSTDSNGGEDSTKTFWTTLKIETASSSETSVPTYKSADGVVFQFTGIFFTKCHGMKIGCCACN